jgi:hypothetical protein
MSPLHRVALALILLLAGVPQAGAQSVRGTLVDGATSQPIQGALVLLLDEGGGQRGGALSSDAGAFIINVPAPGRYRLRAQRIGFGDASTPLFSIAQGEIVERSLTLTAAAIALDGISVQARRRCTVRPRDGQILGDLWSEARRALQAAVFTEGERLFSFEFSSYRRILEPGSLRVVRDSADVRQSLGARSPWVSLPVSRLLSDGFIQRSEQGPVYYAPDAVVLLSDEFLDEYCLGLTASHPDQPDLVGITFAPASRQGPAGVQGTLWLDRSSRELRWFEYRYTRSASPLDEDHRIGGRVEFEPLPSGAWIVRRWWIRMPTGQVRRPITPTPAMRAQELFGGIVEEGGEVLEIRSRGGRQVTGTVGSLEGIVYDSARARPLSDALVFVSGTSYSGTTDAEGRFRIEPLPQGRYDVSVSHPELSRSGIHLPPHAVTIAAGQTAAVTLGVPRNARRDAAARACESDPSAAAGGMLRGRVVDELTRAPLGRARVTVSWGARPGLPAGSTSSIAAPDGSFLACGLPAGAPLVAQASFMGQSGSRAALPEAQALDLVERDLTVAVTRAETILLTVRDWETLAPISGAIVSLPDLERQSISGADGRVRLEGLLEGEHRIEVRHLAYGTQQDRLTVGPGQSDLEMRLSPRAIAIEGVRVVARSAAEEARRRSGSRQSLLLREDLVVLERSAQNLGDIARRLPGVRVREIRQLNSSLVSEICIESARGVMRDYTGPACNEPVMVVIDGMPNFDPSSLVGINAAEIESIEYLSSAEAGGRFGMGSARGVIIIYTRGNGPYARRN